MTYRLITLFIADVGNDLNEGQPDVCIIYFVRLTVLNYLSNFTNSMYIIKQLVSSKRCPILEAYDFIFGSNKINIRCKFLFHAG